MRLRLTAVLTVALLVLAAGPALANVPLTQVSSDPFTNPTSQHRTEVEPDTFAFGQTIVSAFQVGRFFDGGASAIGFATSTDGGLTWTRGFLPGITKFQGGGPFDRASDPAVAFDAGVVICAAVADRRDRGDRPPRRVGDPIDGMM